MPYITSVERIAEARGEAKGGAAVALRPLTRVCGSLPAEVEQRIRQLPLERLEALAEALLEFRCLQDAQAWLDAHDASTEERGSH